MRLGGKESGGRVDERGDDHPTPGAIPPQVDGGGAELESRLFRKLQMIDDATTDQDLRAPPSNHFEKLAATWRFHSIRVNKQWRLVFRWDGGHGEAKGVYLDDHSYR